MEILIPGLILVALMVYASTKIKKRAAAAFDVEDIEAESYSIRKPEGFLHVVGSNTHEFEAYSKEFGDEAAAAHFRKATIEIDVFRDADLKDVRQQLQETTTQFAVLEDTGSSCRIETEEQANENALKGFYKLVGTPNGVYRLRFAVLPKHMDDYLRKIDETLDSFAVKTI